VGLHFNKWLWELCWRAVRYLLLDPSCCPPHPQGWLHHRHCFPGYVNP